MSTDDNGLTFNSRPFKLGKAPAQPARPHLRLSLLAKTLPAPPSKADFYSRVQSWPMYGNDRYGDCVEAGMGHHEQMISRYGTGAEVDVTEDQVLSAYSAITGFRPDDSSTDQGTYVQDALAWWRKGQGLAGHTISAYAAVDLNNATEVKQAIANFGALGLGINFPISAMTQFNAGQPWDVVRGAKVEGGHYVIVLGYDGTYFYVVTWGRIQKMTPAFFRKYADEAWVIIDDEQISALSAFGADLHAFGVMFADLTGEANPFPDQPSPPPAPDPSDHSAEEVAAAVRRTLTELGL